VMYTAVETYRLGPCGFIYLFNFHSSLYIVSMATYFASNRDPPFKRRECALIPR